MEVVKNHGGLRVALTVTRELIQTTNSSLFILITPQTPILFLYPHKNCNGQKSPPPHDPKMH